MSTQKTAAGTTLYGGVQLPTGYVEYLHIIPPSQRDEAMMAYLLAPWYLDNVLYWTGDRKPGKVMTVDGIANEAARHARRLVQLYRIAGKLPFYIPRRDRATERKVSSIMRRIYNEDPVTKDELRWLSSDGA